MAIGTHVSDINNKKRIDYVYGIWQYKAKFD